MGLKGISGVEVRLHKGVLRSVGSINILKFLVYLRLAVFEADEVSSIWGLAARELLGQFLVWGVRVDVAKPPVFNAPRKVGRNSHGQERVGEGRLRETKDIKKRGRKTKASLLVDEAVAKSPEEVRGS